MGVDLSKIKARNPKLGKTRSGADAAYIKSAGSGMQTSNSGQHGSASGPNRMVPSKKSPLGPGPSNKPMGHRRTEEGSQTAGMFGSRPYGGMERARPQNTGERMERYNTEWQRSRERCEGVPKNLYSKKSESPLVKAALASHNSAPYGRTRPADSSARHAAAGAAASPNKGAGRARGVNIWYPNIGAAAVADSGESVRRSRNSDEDSGI